MMHYSAIQILVAVIVIAAAATDLRSRRIPNWLTLSGVCAGLLLNWYMEGLVGIRTSLEGLALGFGVYFVLYCLRAMGAGDVKLMAAVGAIVGPQNWVWVFIATAIAGGVLAAAGAVWGIVDWRAAGRGDTGLAQVAMDAGPGWVGLRLRFH